MNEIGVFRFRPSMTPSTIDILFVQFPVLNLHYPIRKEQETFLGVVALSSPGCS